MSDTPVVPVVVMPKPWYLSRTIIANVIVVVISIVVWITESQGAGILPFHIEPEMLATILSVLNIGLRFITTSPIQGSQP